jgi:hypothetical protein
LNLYNGGIGDGGLNVSTGATLNMYGGNVGEVLSLGGTANIYGGGVDKSATYGQLNLYGGAVYLSLVPEGGSVDIYGYGLHWVTGDRVEGLGSNGTPILYELFDGEASGSSRVFLHELSTTPVPEPTSVALLGIGLLSFFGMRRLRK